ncbi:hypothetical protein [Mycobacterium sp. 050134]|uniref:hypothetical protein n=1 Tax=Mycobacterium sp. 050134 TaxID=3096111 RepID=UPI002ED84C5F
MNAAVRLGLATSLAVSALTHAVLYAHGYQHIPKIGAAFLVQASVSLSLALLVAARGPAWLRWSGAAVAGGSLAAFVLSRTVGLLGFSERGWEPSPYAAISVVAEASAVLLWGASVRWGRRMGSAQAATS